MRFTTLLIALSLLSCSRDVSEPGAGTWVRATWVPIGERPASDAREVARFSASAFDAAWRVDPSGYVEQPLQWTDSRRTALVLAGEGARLAALPVMLTAADLHRLAVVVDVPEGETEALRLAFKTSDLTRAYTDVLTVKGVAGREHLELDLPDVRSLAGSFDRIVVETFGSSSQLQIESLVLSSVPLLANLPTPHSGAELLAVGGDTRRGVALDGTHPVALRLDVPAGARLQLSYRVGPEAALDGATLVLRGTGATEHRVPLRDPAGPAWRTFEHTLERASTGDLQIELEATHTGAFTFLGDAGALVGPADTMPPTVLLITSDTHRGELLGVTSGGLVRTPALDALAARGVYFADAMATSNSTNPSHVALMTGLHPRDSRVVTNRDPVAQRAVTLAERFAAAGYRTAAAYSAFHLSDVTSGLGQGFDRYDGPAAPTGTEVEAFISATSAVRDGSVTRVSAERQLADAEGAPLFLWVHLFDAHAPYVPPHRFDGRYQPPGLDPMVDGPGLPVLPENIPGFLVGVRDPEYPWRQYRALVDYVDHVLEPLLALPRVAAGITAFTSDHGECFGERGIYWNHAGVYPATTHVPLVLAWPGAPVARVDLPVGQSDIGHTLLTLAGLDAEDFEGRDLRWALARTPSTSPRFALGYNARSASVDDGRWVLVLHLLETKSDDGAHSWRPGQVELFDRRADPRCERDLVAVELERAREMRRRLLQWLAAGDPEGYKGEYHFKASIDRALAELGYSGGAEAGGTWYDPSRGDAFLERFGE